MLRFVSFCAALLFLSLPGCAEYSEVWGFDVAAARAKLENGNFGPFLEIDFSEVNPSEVLRIGDGAAYYLAYAFRQEGRTEESRHLFRQSWRADPEPWRRASLIRLLDDLLEQEQYADVLELAAEGLARYPDDVEVESYRYEALYRSRQYAALLLELDTFERIPHAAGRWLPVDRALWIAVAAYRQDRPDWEEQFLAAFRDYRASAHHSRLFLFAVAEGDILNRYHRPQSLLIEARYHLAEDRPGQAARIFRALINEYAENPEIASVLVNAAVLTDIGRATVAGGDWAQTAAALQRLLRVAETHGSAYDRARILEYLGRVQRSVGNRPAALNSFEQAMQLDLRGADRDRVLWYLLQTTVDRDPDATVGLLERYASAISNPALFRNTLDALASRLVQQRNWPALQRAWVALEGTVDAGSVAQYSIINAVALQAGLTEGEEEDIRSYLRQAQRQWENPYYALLAAVLLDRDRGLLNSRPEVPEPAELSPADPLPAEEQDADSLAQAYAQAYVDGYFAFGLLEEGYRQARQRADRLSSERLAQYAQRLGEASNYIDSMRLMDVVARRENRMLPREWALVMYPRAFGAEMGAVIRDETLDPELFFALVREESYFDAGISSHVGATGLAQLMPATAAEVARAMRLDNPVLTDPATNLAIGARYLRGLINRFDSVHDALLGYNAGPTRARRWRAQNGALPPILFQEAVPFHETRHYVRKIFVSAAHYGALYGGLQPRAVLQQIFSNGW